MSFVLLLSLLHVFSFFVFVSPTFYHAHCYCLSHRLNFILCHTHSHFIFLIASDTFTLTLFLYYFTFKVSSYFFFLLTYFLNSVLPILLRLLFLLHIFISSTSSSSVIILNLKYRKVVYLTILQVIPGILSQIFAWESQSIFFFPFVFLKKEFSLLRGSSPNFFAKISLLA